jgi:hypothetical protein
MKLLSPILLGLGLLSAAMASDDTNHLRANTSARQLSTDSSGNGGGTWMWYFMLNALHVIEDHRGGPHSCGCIPELPRCGPPHMHGTCSSHSGSGGSGGGSSGGDDSQAASDGSSAASSSNNGDSNSSYNKSANDDSSGEENYDDNENTNTEEQYLEYNEYNEGSGYANQINGKKNLNVWPFLIAALVVGTVAAALMAKKRKQTTNGGADTLAKSVKRRMQYFQGGSSASVSLSQNGYENES